MAYNEQIKLKELYSPKKVPLNPKTDYYGQTKEKQRPKWLKINDTDLDENPNVLHVGTGESNLNYSEETGNYEHTKLIHSAANRDTLLSLSPSALKLFTWICFQLDFRLEIVDLHPKKRKPRGLKMATQSVNDSILRLEKKGLITRIGKKRAYDYWHFFINPQVIWRGDAKEYYKDVLKHHPEYEAQGLKSPPKKSRPGGTK